MKRVMIIDDDKDFLEEMGCVLISSGYKVAKVSDSTIAVKEAVKFAPGLIFLDLKMDKKSGFNVADELNITPETKDIPIVAITGIFTRQEHRLLMKTYNIKECLTKPIAPLDIISKVEDACK